MKEDVFPKGAAWMDGGFIPLSEAKISVLDWGFLRSDATYDVVHVWKGRFFRLDKHIERFFESTEKLRMPCEFSRGELKKILAGCVDRSGLDNAYVEMIQTRGMSPNFERDPRKSKPRFIAFAVPFGWILKPEEFEKGLDVLVSNRRRISPDSIDSRIKNYHWLDLVSGMYEAYDYGDDTVILTDEKGNISEGPGFNIFCVDKGALYSPNKGVLEGITRQTVLDLAKELNIPFQLSSISLEKLKKSNEVFATSTAGGIMPITKINGQPIVQGEPGEITRKLHKTYWEKHSDSSWSESIEDLLN